MKYEDITSRVIKTYYQVYNDLGHGFLEKVYQNAFFIALKDEGFQVEAQKGIKVLFRGVEVGQYFADLIVDAKVIIELKSVDAFSEEHKAQLVNYLRATNMEVGLLFNFGKTPSFFRKVYDNDLKPNFKRHRNNGV
jgi:GxxExxY protein